MTSIRLVFIFPLIALINLFIYVLQYPTLPSVEEDIGLMYMVAGHFSYLEFAFTEMTFPFTRDVANLARLAVAKARDGVSSKPDGVQALMAASPGSCTRDFVLDPLVDVRLTVISPPLP